MKKIKVLSVFGTRPEAIKMAPLVNLMRSHRGIESIVCVTAQHREMLDSVLNIFNIRADYDLDIMSHSQTVIDISSKVLDGVDKVIKDCLPDLVLVHGDTSTTLNAALAAFYNKVPVGHVEAGLRSGDIYSPFPEELNRKLVGEIARIHFAPTETNKNNLINEGIEENNIFITGNTVIDALISVIKKQHTFEYEQLNNIDFQHKKVILLTTHRRENWGKPMEQMFEAIVHIVRENADVEVVFPMHRNPTIRELAIKYFDGYNDRVHLIEAIEYIDFINLLNSVYIIMTDSGGVQEEAPALGKPVIVLRTETERPEAIKAGTVVLGGTTKSRIIKVTNELLHNKEKYLEMSHATNPYGDGKASQRIVEIILGAYGNE